MDPKPPHRAVPVAATAQLRTLTPLIFVAFLAACFVACGVVPDSAVSADDAGGFGVVDLHGTWHFRAGDVASGGADVSSLGHDVSAWSTAEVPGPFARDDDEVDGHSTAWFRREVAVPSAWLDSQHPLGLRIGKVNSAYEIWAGGERLGGVGELPTAARPGAARPDAARPGRIDYDRHAVYYVPGELLSSDGRLAVALRVWTHPQFGAVGGPHAGPFTFGDYGELLRRESWNEIPKLFFAGLFFLLGLFHLELYRRRRELQGYFWFACVASLFSVYSLLITQWKYRLLPDLPFVVLKEAEHVVVLVLLACFVQLVWILLDIRVGRGTRGVQILSLGLAATLIAWPGMEINQVVLLVFQVLMIWQMFLGIYLVLRELRRKSREARMIFVGALTGSGFFFHDVLVDRGLLHDPRLTTYGFALFVLFLAATLGEQFARRLRQAEAARRREEEMRRAEEVARRSNEAKTEFLANVSHEIRTPMTAILGGLELLANRDLPEGLRSRLKVIHRSARDLLRVIDEILDFSKVEAGRIELSESDFDPRRSLRGLVDLYVPEARARGVSIHITGVDSLPRSLHGDVGRWRQVLLNVLSNAVKFTPEGQVEIRVSGRPLATARRDGADASDDGSTGAKGAGGERGAFEVRVEVEDSGIGIEPEHLEHLFQPFTQADASTSRRYGGTGLGLAISHRLTRLLGGRIAVESRVGEGSTFTITVPFRVARHEAPSSGEYAVYQPPPTAEDGAARILLAEDNEVNQMIVTGHLEALGYEVLVAADGREVLEILDRERVDGVLMDCQMPRLDGYDATREIRARDGAERGVPVIALTAHAFEGERERCLDAGMDDYLSKPFRSVELRRVLERWVGPP